MGLWLFDAGGDAIHEIAEYASVVTTERYREHSEFTGKFHPDDFSKFEEAFFAQMSGEQEVYLVERLKLTSGKSGALEVSGRSASALLGTRAIVGTGTWSAKTAGTMIADIMGEFTGSRAIALTFGTGTAVGSTFSAQRTWAQADVAALELLAVQSLGMRTRMDGTTVKLDVFAAADAGVNLGEKFGDGSTARLITDETSWKNFAYVLGEQPEAVFQNATAKTLVSGTTVSGSGASIDTADSTPWVIGESSATDGFIVDAEFTVAAGNTAGEVKIVAYYDGLASTHYVNLFAWDYDLGTWELLTQSAFPSSGSTYAERKYAFGERHISRTTGKAKFRLAHDLGVTFNAAHRFRIDQWVASFSAPRVQVAVDQVGSADRREMIVEAEDIQRGSLSLAAYQALLAARGAASLADTRKLEYAEADGVSTPLRAGDIVWYDAGPFGSSFMASEVVNTYEGPGVQRTVSMGDPPPTLKKSLRRYL